MAADAIDILCTPLAKDALTPRSGHSATSVGHGDIVVIFGGATRGLCGNELVVLDTRTGEHWAVPAPRHAPSPRMAHTATLVLRRGCIILFGGGDGERLFSDTWSLDLAATSLSREDARSRAGSSTGWSELASVGATPAPRMGHSATVTPDDRALVVFGGFSAEGSVTSYSAEFWVLDIDAQSWSQVLHPHLSSAGRQGLQGRLGAAAATCAGMVLFYGGSAGGQVLNELVSVAPQATPGPGQGSGPDREPVRLMRVRGRAPPRVHAAALSLAQSVLYVGGQDPDGTVDGVVVLDVTSWTFSSVALRHVEGAGLGPRCKHTLTPLAGRNGCQALIWGGVSSEGHASALMVAIRGADDGGAPSAALGRGCGAAMRESVLGTVASPPTSHCSEADVGHRPVIGQRGASQTPSGSGAGAAPTSPLSSSSAAADDKISRWRTLLASGRPGVEGETLVVHAGSAAPVAEPEAKAVQAPLPAATSAGPSPTSPSSSAGACNLGSELASTRTALRSARAEAAAAAAAARKAEERSAAAEEAQAAAKAARANIANAYDKLRKELVAVESARGRAESRAVEALARAERAEAESAAIKAKCDSMVTVAEQVCACFPRPGGAGRGTPPSGTPATPAFLRAAHALRACCILACARRTRWTGTRWRRSAPR